MSPTQAKAFPTKIVNRSESSVFWQSRLDLLRSAVWCASFAGRTLFVPFPILTPIRHVVNDISAPVMIPDRMDVVRRRCRTCYFHAIAHDESNESLSRES